MKKLMFLLIALFVLLTFTTCETLSSMGLMQEPVVSLNSVDLTNISLNGVQLLAKVQIENPNSIEIPFPQTDWELFVNANSFISGTIRNNERIRARGSTVVEVPVYLDYLGIFNSFTSLFGNRQFDYKTAFALTFNLPVLGEKVMNLAHDGTIPLPQLPQINTPSMRISSSNITRTEILVTINVVNPNIFPIPSPRITYDYQINRNSFIRGNVESDEPLAASSVTPITIPLTVNYADLFRSFASLLLAREAASLFVVSLDPGIPLLRSEPVRFEVAGTLPILR